MRWTAQASQALVEELGKGSPKAEDLERASVLVLVAESAEELAPKSGMASVVLELVSNLEVAEVSVLVSARESVLELELEWALGWAKAWVED